MDFCVLLEFNFHLSQMHCSQLAPHPTKGRNVREHIGFLDHEGQYVSNTLKILQKPSLHGKINAYSIVINCTAVNALTDNHWIATATMQLAESPMRGSRKPN